jgi:hypothetical protein
MARLIFTARFRSDASGILDSRRFRITIERLIGLPQSGAPRPTFGQDARIAIVSPYILIYDYVAKDDTVVLLRVLHERRNITRELAPKLIEMREGSARFAIYLSAADSMDCRRTC